LPVPLEEGCRIATAPRFSIEPAWAWSERLRINSGVREDDGRFFPHPDWRPATDAELAQLVPGPHRPQHEFPTQDLCLFAITEHLRSRFWSLAQGGLGGSAEGDDWFSRFARDLAEFARFKGLPLPPSCTFDLKVSKSGQPSTRIDAAAGDGRLAGLDLDRPDSGPRPLGGINLGDEPSGLVILNLRPVRIKEVLSASEPPEASPATPRDLTRRFLSRFPSYPIVRVILRPGEGYWLPDHGLIFDGDTTGLAGIDVRMEFRGGE
jgi:hypothetical protein